jgi:hypothetical protein
MASPLQRAALRRKLIYFGVIVALFTISIFWRGKLPVPFGDPARAAERAPSAANRYADALSRQAVLSKAERLDLRELDQGDPEIAGSALRLGVQVVGARGLALTAVWRLAIEKQKRNEFQEFEGLARLATRLQPHFITPWVFQSWNIAYNVSVENDKLGDMYFYIARGIELLSEGDRLNTKVYHGPDGDRSIGSPDIRHQIGFYYQNKFSVSDKVSTLRSLMQLSCIPPAERRPSSLRSGGQVDPQAFKEFCEKNPQLVRRLRTKLNCTRPEDVVQFLEDNTRVPTRWKPNGEMAEANDQFPALPPPFPEGPDEYYPGKPTDDTFDAFLAARAWFLYSQTAVPPPKKDEYGDPIPWRSPLPEEYDRFRYRVPRAPALIIFRQMAPRAQTYLAERLAKEGWFDETSTWNPNERAGAGNTWFGESGEVQLSTHTGSKSQWAEAWKMWKLHGEQNGLILSDITRRRLEETAGMKGAPNFLPPTDAEQLKAMGLTPQQADAMRALFFYDQNRHMTNFPYFLESSTAEKEPITVSARKLLWQADQARQNAENIRAIRYYVEGLARWREVLLEFPRFHRPGGRDQIEEDTYEQELKLIQLMREDGAVRAKADQLAHAAAALIPASGHPELANQLRADYLQAAAEQEAMARITAAMIARGTREAAQTAARRIEQVSAATAAVVGGAIEADRNAITRRLIDTEFAWMKEFKYQPAHDGSVVFDQSAYWVSPTVRESVKQRLGLVRKAAAPPEAQPTTEAQPSAAGQPAPR